VANQDSFMSLRLMLRRIRNTATGLLDELQEIESCKPVECVQRCRNLHRKLFNKHSEYFGFADKAAALEFEVDDGLLWKITEAAIMECASQRVIDSNDYGLNSLNPDWQGALHYIEDLPLEGQK